MRMGAKETIRMPMLALTEQVDVEIFQLRGESVGIDMIVAFARFVYLV